MEPFALSTMLAQCPPIVQAWGQELYQRSAKHLHVSHESVRGLYCAMALLKRLITEAHEAAEHQSGPHQIEMQVPTIEEALKDTAPDEANADFADAAFHDEEIHTLAEILLAGVTAAVKELEEFEQSIGYSGFGGFI